MSASPKQILGPESHNPNRTLSQMNLQQMTNAEILSSPENIEAWRMAIRAKLAHGNQVRAGFNLLTSAGFYPLDGFCRHWRNDRDGGICLTVPNLMPITVLRVLLPVTHRV